MPDSPYMIGVTQVIRNLKFALTHFQKKSIEAVKRTCIDIAKDAKAGHRKGTDSHSRDRFESQTGTLIRSITSKMTKITETDIEGQVFTNLEYAPYVELGTFRSRPYPFLQPALMNNLDKYRERLARIGLG